MSSSSDLLVIGLGNRLRGDDAVGLHLAGALAGNTPHGVEVRIREQADPLDLAHDILEWDGPLLAVDCAAMGLEPGEWRLFASDEARLRCRSDGISTHGPGLADALALAEALGRKGATWIFDVQPARVEPVDGLSSEVEGRLPEMVAALYDAVIRLTAESAAR